LIRASVQHEPLFADEGGFVRGHVARDMRARPTQNEAR
jgi:hypothetical protein